MKNILRVSTFFMLSLFFVFLSCTKESDSSTKDYTNETSGLKEDVMLDGGGRYEKVITKRLIKPDDCRFIVSGTIEYHLDGVVVAIIDYGDGACDNVATKMVRGVTTRFLLEPTGGDLKYRKIVTEPLIRLDDCEYIVSGIIEFYQNGAWAFTIDFGNGECDNMAIKYWDGGRKQITLHKIGE